MTKLPSLFSLFKLSEMGKKQQQTKSLNTRNQLYYSQSDTQNSKLLLLPQKETLKNNLKFFASFFFPSLFFVWLKAC